MYSCKCNNFGLLAGPLDDVASEIPGWLASHSQQQAQKEDGSWFSWTPPPPVEKGDPAYVAESVLRKKYPCRTPGPLLKGELLPICSPGDTGTSQIFSVPMIDQMIQAMPTRGQLLTMSRMSAMASRVGAPPKWYHSQRQAISQYHRDKPVIPASTPLLVTYPPVVGDSGYKYDLVSAEYKSGGLIGFALQKYLEWIQSHPGMAMPANDYKALLDWSNEERNKMKIQPVSGFACDIMGFAAPRTDIGGPQNFGAFAQDTEGGWGDFWGGLTSGVSGQANYAGGTVSDIGSVLGSVVGAVTPSLLQNYVYGSRGNTGTTIQPQTAPHITPQPVSYPQYTTTPGGQIGGQVYPQQGGSQQSMMMPILIGVGALVLIMAMKK